MRLAPFAATLLASPLLAQAHPPGTDWIIPAGTNVTYDTSFGPVDAHNVVIEAGATLRVYGSQPFRLRSTRLVQIDGTLDLSGFFAPDVNCLNCSGLQSPGGQGGPGGGTGGIANVNTTTWTPAGSDATDALGNPWIGGLGGHTAFRNSADNVRRPGGGGGGGFGPDLPLVNPDPDHVANIGRLAHDGFLGTQFANDAVLGLGVQPQGGLHAGLAFVNANPLDDFWGRELDPFTGQITVGELAQLQAGRGGGGGGDSIQSDVYPPTIPFTVSGPERGAGGGGGGGLGIVSALLVRFGANGHVRSNGGHGGSGENSLSGGITRIAGGGGGGSGGLVLLQARVIDLRLAGAQAIVALGGAGGHGENDFLNATCAGGSGGPGLIQLHVANASQILLPPSTQLDELTLPPAHVLLPEALP